MYFHIGTVGHIEHAQRDGSELSHGNAVARRRVFARDPRSQWRSTQVDELEDRAVADAEPAHDVSAQANRTATLEIEAATGDDADSQPSATQLRTPRGGRGIIRDPVAQDDAIDPRRAAFGAAWRSAASPRRRRSRPRSPAWPCGSPER